MKVKATKNRSVNIRVKQTEYDDIKRVAERDKISMTQVVTNAVRWYIYGIGEKR